jgi:ketosteroid isomerase-like protein
MTRFLCIVLALGLAAVAPVAAQGADPRLEALVAAERKFAAASVATSTQAAFLANLGEDSILFAPYARPGRAWTESNPGGKGLLTWEPSYALLSSSGDLGLTTGPWEYRKGRSLDEPPVASGHFSTVWRRHADGVWRVAIDCGVAYPRPAELEAAWSPNSGRGGVLPAGQGDGAKAPESLAAAESAFESSLAAKGVDATYTQFLGADPRVYRDNRDPAIERASAIALARADGAAVAWKTEGVVASKSGDLGYTYGRGERPGQTAGGAERFTFLRVWQHGAANGWRIVLEVVNLVPSDAK